MAAALLAGHGAAGRDTPVGPANVYALGDDVPAWDPDRARRLLSDAGLLGITVGLDGRRVDAAPDLRDALSRAGLTLSAGTGAVTLRPATGQPTEDWAFATDPVPGTHWVAGEKTRARFDGLLRQGRAASASSKRAELFAEMQRLVAALGSAAVPLHADFLFAGTARLAHGPAIGRTGTLDNGRIAERWWFA